MATKEQLKARAAAIATATLERSVTPAMVGTLAADTIDFAASCAGKPFTRLDRLAPYLYEAWYPSLDYDHARAVFRAGYAPQVGACSAVRYGDQMLHNLDWYYSHLAEFMVHTPAADGRYASIGMCGNLPGLTDDFVRSGEQSDLYRLLPFVMADGMNEYGVMACMNVVPSTGPHGRTTGTNPGKPDLCGLMLVRHVLDSYQTAQQACNDIQSNWNVYMPDAEGMSQELHYLIADSSKTFILEFSRGAAVVIDVTGQREYMTNFHQMGVTYNADGTVNVASLEPYAQGVERYNAITEYMTEASPNLMSLSSFIAFTKAYTTPLFSEFTSAEQNFQVSMAMGNQKTPEFLDYVTAAHRAYESRDRANPQTWHTQHSVIYNKTKMAAFIYVQEMYDKMYLAQIGQTLQRVNDQVNSHDYDIYTLKRYHYDITSELNKGVGALSDCALLPNIPTSVMEKIATLCGITKGNFTSALPTVSGYFGMVPVCGRWVFDPSAAPKGDNPLLMLECFMNRQRKTAFYSISGGYLYTI